MEFIKQTPPKKRRKLNFGDQRIQTFNCDNIQIEAVMDKKLEGPISLVPVVVLKIVDRKNISKVVKWLTENFPVPELSHLKRIKKGTEEQCQFFAYIDKLQHLLPALNHYTDHRTLSKSNESEIWKYLSSKNMHQTWFDGKLEIVLVPIDAPRCDSQYLEASKYWPCVFHKDIFLQSLMSGDYFTKELKEYVSSYMNKVISLSSTVKPDLGQPKACVLVRDNSSIYSSQDARHIHPLYHSAAVCIDMVASSLGGGTLPLNDLKARGLSLEYSASGENEDGKYICSDCDVFLSNEPCMFCAMALLHSRVKRIFFYSLSPNVGVLKSLCRLHTQNGINHKYNVFQVKRS